MIIERFKNGDPVPVYRQFRDKGRMAPDGLTYVMSWVTEDLSVCYQVMETDDPALLEAWKARWANVCDLEVIPIMTSKDAVAKVGPRL
jgi:hypothetical protein